MARAVILNTIDDAQHFINNQKILNKENCYLFSTHSSVDVFLSYKYKIKCECLSKFISSKQARDNIRTSDAAANRIVDYLDKNYSPGINKQAGFKNIRFFRALYGYISYFQFNICLNLIQAIKTVIEKYNLKEILFYDKKLNSWFDFPTTLEKVLNLIENIDAKFIKIVKDVNEKKKFPLSNAKNFLFGDIFLLYKEKLLVE